MKGACSIPKKKLIQLFIIPIAALALLYGSGYLSQLFSNYRAWQEAGAVFGTSPTFPDAGFFPCLAAAFHFPYGLYGLGLCIGALALLILMVMRMGYSEGGEYDRQRNLVYSDKGTYLVRYADDFIIATDTRAHAEDWKARLQSFLQEKMKLTLSQEKTLITDIRKKYIKFLGYEFKMVRGKSRRGYIPRTIPDRERLKRRADKIAEDIKKIPGNYSREQMVGAINRINSQIRGIIQYYQCCTWVNIAMQKHSRKLQLAARRRLKQYNGKWIPANQTRNLPRVHQQYKQKIPSIKYRDIYVGFTALTFCRWERTPPKNQAETPYTDTGRQLYFERTKKKKMQARLDEMYSDRSARAISYGKWGKFNNFEFIMNRAYALNRDKLRCRVCGGWLIANTPWAHRINPYLPLDKVNRVNNLISLHKKCFIAVNNPNQDISEFDVKAQKKIVGYRDKLVISHTRNK